MSCGGYHFLHCRFLRLPDSSRLVSTMRVSRLVKTPTRPQGKGHLWPAAADVVRPQSTISFIEPVPCLALQEASHVTPNRTAYTARIFLVAQRPSHSDNPVSRATAELLQCLCATSTNRVRGKVTILRLVFIYFFLTPVTKRSKEAMLGNNRFCPMRTT